MSEFAQQIGSKFEAGKRQWHVPVDIVLPCATQNELDEHDAKTLIANGLVSTIDGANIAGFVKVVEAILGQGLV